MRQSGKPASLAELMGESGEGSEQIGLKHLPKLLGEKMPEMPYNRIGRYRLNNALKLRFGPGYKNIPGVKNILSEFDEHMETENTVKMNKESRNG